MKRYQDSAINFKVIFGRTEGNYVNSPSVLSITGPHSIPGPPEFKPRIALVSVPL